MIYASYGLWGLACLVAAGLISYGLALLIPKHRWLMWVSVTACSLWLVALRLQGITGLTLLAPLGVSYFTLQIISYHVDIYRGKYPPERNLFRYLMFITYIPHLFIGPIEPYDRLTPAIFENRRFSFLRLLSGGIRLMWGLLKKYLIATRVNVLVSAISGAPEQYSGAYALAAMVLYAIQIYADFSGGMDMILGVSDMLGITLSENFDAPYFSQSVQEFWRRWHITLGAWLRQYVYIPLGGNRKGKLRKYLNLVITFLVSGLWHGIHYLLWGLLNGIFVAIGDRLKTRFRVVNVAGTFLVICFLWSFFVWPNTVTALKMIASVFTAFPAPDFLSGIGAMGLSMGDFIVLGAGVLAVLLGDIFRKRLGALRLSTPAKTAILCTLVLIVLVYGMYGFGFEAQSFIYSKF